MSYLIELETPTGNPGYVIVDGNNAEEALTLVKEQLDSSADGDVVVFGVHTVH
jgi:hypothetical protein